MESGTHPSPFPVLCVSDAKQVPIYSWVDRECSSRRMAKPGFERTTSRRLSTSLPHNRVVLTTRSRDFSSEKNYNICTISEVAFPYAHQQKIRHISVILAGDQWCFTCPAIYNDLCTFICTLVAVYSFS